MKRKNLTARILFEASRFISFYLLIAIIITVNMLLFLDNIALTEEMIRTHAKLTFLNTIVLAVLGCFIDEFRRRRTTDRSLMRIMDALDKITKGDFSVRLDVNDRLLDSQGFRQISIGINVLAQELSGVETLRTDFIANVSHELKTPLAVVQNYAVMLKDPGLLPEKREEYACAISRTTKQLAELVSKILKLNKLDNQQIFPQTRTFDLSEQLCQCILDYESAWTERQLDCHIQDQVMVEADPELLLLIWNNLLSNAIKFTPEGGRISVSLKLENGCAVVCIADTGCGMTKETGERIFEKFYQGDTAHATQGNGLGLALVKRVVDITGGVIRVSSTPGKGSAFTVQLGRATDGSV